MLLPCRAGEILHPLWRLHFPPLQECSGSFSLSGIKVQSTQMEEDVRLEALFVPIAKGLFYQTLYFIVKALNGTIEGLNNKIQGLIKKAFGYRNKDRFKSDIFFHLGGLDLYPEIGRAHV